MLTDLSKATRLWDNLLTMHMIIHPLFAISLLWLLAKEKKAKFAPTNHMNWLVAGVGFSALAFVVYHLDMNIYTNFFLHGVGGGVATTMTYFYLKAHTGWKFTWWVDLMFLFGLVSAFGVLNELFEYSLELAGVMVSAWDTHDTWRDFVANTTGAFMAWSAIAVYSRIIRK
jgi:hypothetical protein